MNHVGNNEIVQNCINVTLLLLGNYEQQQKQALEKTHPVG